MKKGITLIELLAVIIILAIIGSISFITIGNIVKNSKINLYNENITKIKDTAEMYISNGNKGYIEEGQTVEITLDELISDGYIKEVNSPFDKTKTCNGYILVTKLVGGDYSYNTHINCAENINNSTEDGLVLHYTFDDFQEPTINVSINDGQNGISPFRGDGLPFYSIIDNTVTFRDKKVAKFKTGASGNFYINGSDKLLYSISSNNWTSTLYIKRVDNIPITSNVGTYMYISNNTNVNAQVVPKLVEDGWYEIKRTRSNLIFGYVSLFGCYGLGSGVEYYIADWMIEPKIYSTKYTGGTRDGIVKDYSINNNSSNLSLINTPKWMYEEGIENGEYSFNGSNTYISLNNIDASQPYTVLLWAKANTVLIDGANPPTGLNRKTLIVGPGPVWNPGIWVTKDNLRIHCSNYHKDYHITWDDLGWHSVGQIYDGNDCYAIFDGNILQPYRTTVYNPPVTSTLLIGAETFVGSAANWNGLIDDVRIYSRALSEKEIRNIYYSTR